MQRLSDSSIEARRMTETTRGVEQVRPIPSHDGTNIVFNSDWPDGKVYSDRENLP